VPETAYATLSAYLWDLRASAESKLRCLTRLQRELAALERATRPSHRAGVREKIVDDLNDLAAISKTFRSLSQDAVKAAAKLPR